MVLIYALSGEAAKAEEACQAERGIESRTLLGCYWEDIAGIGLHYLRQGQGDEAREYLERSISVFQERNQVAAVSGCSFVLGCLYLDMGNHARAEELLLRSLDICQKGGNVLFELWVLPVLAELYLKMGQPEKAAGYGDRGWELLEPDQNWYGLPAPIHLAKGMLASTRENWDQAAESFHKALAINRQYQLPYDEAQCLFEWGNMHLKRDAPGDRQQGMGLLDQALAVFQRCGARKDVEKVLARKQVLKA